MKKILSLALALCLLLGCMTIASADETSGISYPFDGTNEPFTILMLTEQRAQNAGYANWNETELVKALIEKTGINVKFVEAFDATALKLVLADGKYPDAIMTPSKHFDGGLTAMIRDELAIDLTPYAASMPDILAVVNSLPEYVRGVTHVDGGMYYIPNLLASDNVTTHWRGMVVRQDFLDKLNMEVPTNNDELYNMLLAFKNELGCDMPLAGPWWKNVLLVDGFITTEYGIPTTGDYEVEGVYHYGAYEEGYRGVMAYMNKLYKDGLLDLNFQTTDEKTSQAALLNGETGLHPTSCARIATISARATDENFKLTGIGSMNGTDGTRAMYTQTESIIPSHANNEPVFITADCKNPELLIAFFNYLFTEEGMILGNFGVEGLCWTEGENGEHVLTEYITANESGLSMDQMLWVQGMMDRPGVQLNELAMYRFALPEQKAAMAAWDQTDVAKYMLPGFDVADKKKAEEVNALWTDINTYKNECCVKFITGELNTEGDFDAYIAQLKKMGMDRVIEIRQEALDAYYAAGN